MSSLKIKKGSSANLGSVPIQDGQLLFTTDTQQIYLDNNNTRIECGNTTKATIFSNKSAAFSSNTTYTDYPYRASIALTGVTSSMYASVCFNMTEAISGNYAPICETYNGGVYIYSKINTTITVPTIIIFTTNQGG